jgi:hypothetical protein
MIPGTGYTCGPITKANPCKVNGVVIQDDPTFTDIGRGFVNNYPLQFDPRIGIAWDPLGDAKMVVRFGLGAYHESAASSTFTGGPAFQFDQTIRYTDLNSYFLGSGPTSPTNTSGIQRLGNKLPVTYQYNFGIQKDIGFKTVVDIAYVGSNTHHTSYNWNHNLLPSGIRFRPSVDRGDWIARAILDGLGMLYPLTPKGDCHGNEEKSQEETSQEEEVGIAKKSCK